MVPGFDALIAILVNITAIMFSSSILGNSSGEKGVLQLRVYFVRHLRGASRCPHHVASVVRNRCSTRDIRGANNTSILECQCKYDSRLGLRSRATSRRLSSKYQRFHAAHVVDAQLPVSCELGPTRRCTRVVQHTSHNLHQSKSKPARYNTRENMTNEKRSKIGYS